MNSRRARWHDYRECRIYQLTITVMNRDAAPFGILTGNDEASAAVALNALGKVLNDEICGMERRHSQIVLIEHVVMPDHCHILLEVKQPLPEHLGNVVWGIKYGVTSAYLNALTALYGKPCRIEGSRPSLSERQKKASQMDMVGPATGDVIYVPPLWASGYHDRIVSKRGQLAQLRRYIVRNPARLWAKRHSDHWHMQLSDEFLMLRVVEAERLLSLCEREGAVLISPFISWSEKMVLRLARCSHYPHIIVEPTAMGQYYKLSDATRSIAKQQVPAWWSTSKYGRLLSATQERSDMQCGTGGEILVIAPWHDRPESDINGKAEMELMNEICAVLAEHQA